MDEDQARRLALKLYADGVGHGRILHETGISWKDVVRLAKRARLPARKGGSAAVHTPEARAEALRLHDDGMSPREVRARTGVPSCTLYAMRLARGDEPRKTKTTREEVVKVYLEVGSAKATARRLGVTASTVERHIQKAELAAAARGEEDAFQSALENARNNACAGGI